MLLNVLHNIRYITRIQAVGLLPYWEYQICRTAGPTEISVYTFLCHPCILMYLHLCFTQLFVHYFTE